MVEKHSGYDLDGELKIKTVSSEVGQVLKGQGSGNDPVWGFDDYGQSFIGIVTTATDGTHFKASALTGFGNGYFVGYYVYVIWDAGAGGAAPQNEAQPISAYVSSDGTFTHTAFSAQTALTDKVLIVHPSIARAAEGYYFEQLCPLQMNAPLVVANGTMNNTAATKVFVATNSIAASGLISTTNAKMQKASLIIIGRAVNTYAGANALDCTTAAHNQWQMSLDAGAFADVANAAADGQMLDNNWQMPVEGSIHPFTFMWDVTAVLTNNIDGKIGVQLLNARSEAASVIITIDVYLKILWKL